MKRADNLKLKTDSHDCDLNAKQRAKADRKRVRNFKSPDINKKKFSYYSDDLKCYMYADSERVLNSMIRNLAI